MIIAVTEELDEEVKQAAIAIGAGRALFRLHGHVISGRANLLVHELTDEGLAMLEAILEAIVMPIALQVRDECSKKARSIGYPHVSDAILLEPIEIRKTA